jgi:putative membrane protein
MTGPRLQQPLRTSDEQATPRLPVLLLIAGLAILVWSGCRPTERFTWFLEVFPAIFAGLILVATYRRFRFSSLVYVLIWIHAIILMLGGHWTYAEMPLFNWIRDALGLHRNYYDRLGHVAQGFIPAIVVRELLLRTSPLRPGKWLVAVVIFTCLGISAAYELLEWGVAMAIGQSADKFLATQGDVWDTQWDMFMAVCGAIAALVLVPRLHDRSMARVAQCHPFPLSELLSRHEGHQGH